MAKSGANFLIITGIIRRYGGEKTVLQVSLAGR
jgi:hypothetical protein